MTDELLVGIAADEPLRTRIAALLERTGMVVVAQAESADDLVRACNGSQPHVAVLCWQACPDGPATVRRVADAMARTRIVTVLPKADRSAIRAALGAGAEGVVASAHVVLTLALVVRSVWLGQASVPREAAGDLDASALSHREEEVLGLAAEGLGNAEIAVRLCVTESTVKSHLTSMFLKLGVHSRTEAISALRDRRPSDDARDEHYAGAHLAINGGQA
jgi:DNA-binding NarL/FixJ family response regulator